MCRPSPPPNVALVSDVNRDKLAARLAKMPGLRSVRSPETEVSPTFDLSYIRSGNSETAWVVFPGGPGLASVLPYRRFRRQAAKRGLDVLMVEHRGVGLSRKTPEGEDLPPSAITLEQAADDVAAVLQAEGLNQVFVYGSSYGSYLAQLFSARHPDRVAGMVLDSAMAGADDHHDVRSHARALLWEGESASTAQTATLLRELVESGRVSQREGSEIARIIYEFSGPDVLETLLRAHVKGRVPRTWSWLSRLGGRELTEVSPLVMEFDLVGRIAFRELNYAPEPDGGPFDPAAGFDENITAQHGPFQKEPVQLAQHWPEFRWPSVVLSGARDLRTPPAIARRIAENLPDGLCVTLPDTGHSALDTHNLAAIATMKAVEQGQHRLLNSEKLGALRRTGLNRHIGTLAQASLAAEARLRRLRLRRTRR